MANENQNIIGAGQDTAHRAPKDIKILAACEESQAVCIAFRALGFDAYSCDIQPCSGGHDERHLQADISKVLEFHKWDLVIAFPPCTHLCSSGARHFAAKRADGRQQQGIDFFMRFTKLDCRWAIENPVGIMSSLYRRPNQIIQPWQFGHRDSKATCLWLNGLPSLVPTAIVEPVWCENLTAKGKKTSASHNRPRWENQTPSGQNKLGPSPERAKLRAKTYPGIAKAMAEQWGAHVLCANSPAQNAEEVCHTSTNSGMPKQPQLALELGL
jgi:hypothetical protein